MEQHLLKATVMDNQEPLKAIALDIEEFAVAFTISVTEVSDPTNDLVAKNGKHSIFSALEEIFPQATAIMILLAAVPIVGSNIWNVACAMADQTCHLKMIISIA